MVGQPVPGIEVQIRGDDGTVLGPGEVGELFVRGETDTAFTRVLDGPATPGDNTIHAIALDPQDWRRVYVIRGNQVLACNDVTAATPTFADITGNLTGAAGQTPQVRSLTLFDNTPDKAGDAVVLVGGLGGVYRLVAPNLASPQETCPRRDVTTIAPQALTLLNSKLSRDWSEAFAGRVIREAGP